MSKIRSTKRNMHVIRFENYARSSRIVFFIMLMVIGLATGLVACNAGKTPEVTAVPTQQTMLITQSTLEEQYGIRVTLVAVTAAGGLVDVRFKFLDGAKAGSLLQDATNFPLLLVGEKEVVLNVPEDARPQEVSYVDDGNLFLMYPNAADVVKPGTAVSIVFGNVQVEPILAK
jgi:hypothetical protein